MEAPIARDVADVAAIAAVPKILEVVCHSTGLRFAAVARVTERHWVACAVRDAIDFGLVPGGELELESTICNEIRDSRQLVVIDDVATHDVYCHHPTPRRYGFRSYISTPIVRADGRFFGTLCAIDPAPAVLNNPRITGMFTLFAELIALQMDAQERFRLKAEALAQADVEAGQRERFISMLGHELRTPLTSLEIGAGLLRKIPLEDRAAQIAGIVESSAKRMASLVGDVLDLAKARLGRGVPIRISVEPQLNQVLESLIAELRLVQSDCDIAADIVIDEPVQCDGKRIAQLAANLIQNACIHGDHTGKITVRAYIQGDELVLSVANSGPAIPAEKIVHLFEPFAQLGRNATKEGLGLGLYISAEIARAHGGSLRASSTAALTEFTLRMPTNGSGTGK